MAKLSVAIMVGIGLFFACGYAASAQEETPTPSATPNASYLLPTPQNGLPICTFTPQPTQNIIPYVIIPYATFGAPATETPTLTPAVTPTPNVTPAPVFYSETYTFEWVKGTGIWFSQRTHTYINESQLVAVAWRPVADNGGFIKRMRGLGPGNDAWNDTSDDYASGYYCTSDLFDYMGYPNPAAICSSLAPGATILGSAAPERWITHQAPGTEGKQGWQCYGHSDNYVNCSLEVTVWRYGIPPAPPTATPTATSTATPIGGAIVLPGGGGSPCVMPDQAASETVDVSNIEIQTGACYTIVPSTVINTGFINNAIESIVDIDIPDTVGWSGFQLCVDYLVVNAKLFGLDLVNVLNVIVWMIAISVIVREIRS